MNDAQPREGTPAKALCGAKTKAGGTCQLPAMENGRCRFHGGATPKGAASPQFKHGGYSKYLPRDLAKRSREILQNPDIVSLRNVLGLQDLRLSQILEQLRDGGSHQTWMQLRNLRKEYREAQDAEEAIELDSMDEPDPDAGRPRRQHRDPDKILSELLWVIDEGADQASLESRTWNEARELMMERRLVSQTEARYLIAGEQMVTAEQAYAILRAVEESVMRNVPDPAVRLAIAADIQRLAGVP